jgi:hypothetical protein
MPPSVYPHQPLAYRQAFGGPRAPTGVMVLSILGIVLASLSLLVGAYGLLMGAGTLMMSRVSGTPAVFNGMMGYMAWEAGTAVVRGLIGVLLMVMSIASLRVATWGRAGMVRYAQVDLAWIVLKLILAVTWAIPYQQAMFNNMIQQAVPSTTGPTTAPSGGATTAPTVTPGPASMISTGSAGVTTVAYVSSNTSTSISAPAGVFEPWLYGQAGLVAVVSAIYPIVVWRYMTRRRVREAFHGVVPPPR